MTRPALALVGTAVLLGAVDVVHKAVALAADPDAVVFHERGAGYAVLGAVAVAWAAALLAARSTVLAVAGGVLLGGAVGNLGSLALRPGDGVPNPLVAEIGGAGVAFTLADVFALGGGLVVVPVSVAVVAWRGRARLREPVRVRR